MAHLYVLTIQVVLQLKTRSKHSTMIGSISQTGKGCIQQDQYQNIRWSDKRIPSSARSSSFHLFPGHCEMNFESELTVLWKNHYYESHKTIKIAFYCLLQYILLPQEFKGRQGTKHNINWLIFQVGRAEKHDPQWYWRWLLAFLPLQKKFWSEKFKSRAKESLVYVTTWTLLWINPQNLSEEHSGKN